MTDSLKGRIALVTGASKGIGKAIALKLAEAGADVALCARSLPELERAADEVRLTGARVLVVRCDVTDAEQVKRLGETVGQEFGAVDILVNNAGAAGSHKFVGHPDDLWQRMIDINMTSVYRVCKSFVPRMIERRWGRIITIASISSKIGARYITAYAASKHGVLGLMRALAVELNPYHITVNAICPGYVETPMTEAAVANISSVTGKSQAEALQILESTNPQQRLITPDEVAAVALMLAGDSARGITGQAINVDGGLLSF